MIGARLLRALRGNVAETRADHEDPGLRGRTYAIPFDRVWREALRLARERRTWTLTRTDDQEGVIEAEARTPVLPFTDDVEIRIGLDEDAQTRLDLRSASRKGAIDLGTNARRIRRFVRHLDRALEAWTPSPRPAGEPPSAGPREARPRSSRSPRKRRDRR